MPLADRLAVSWVTELRLQALDSISALPALVGWYVFLRGLAAEGIGVFESAVFGSTLLLFSVFGVPLAATVVVTSAVRYTVSGSSPHWIDAVLASLYITGLAVFVVVTTVNGTARPTGAGGTTALLTVVGATLSTAVLSVVVLGRPLATAVDKRSPNDEGT
jgi:hypothetical protein